jgi:short-subunit dehydrogenase
MDRMSLPKAFLEGKVAIITGASAGIGAEVARALAHRGMNVVLAARRQPRLATLAAEIEHAAGTRALAVPTDVGVRADLERLVRQTLATFQRIDVLINNAGIEEYALFHELTPERIDELVLVNLTAALQLGRMVVPHMLSQGWGHIVNMSSMAGKHGPPYGAVHAATKAALVAWTQSLRLEYRRERIRCSVICPGFTTSSGILDAIQRQSGRPLPRLIGSTTATKVARETVRAIRKDRPETIVNNMPLRPFLVLAEAFPAFGEYLFRKLGLRYFRQLADSRASRPQSPADGSSRDAA